MSAKYSYLLKCNLGGPAAEKVKTLAARAAELSEDFGVVHNSYEQHWYSPHFTLKYHFTMDDVQAAALWEQLENFSSKTIPASGKLVGLGNFGTKVIFAEHEHSEEATKIVNDLMVLLNSCDWITWTPVDNRECGPSLHSTVVKDDEDRAGPELLSLLNSTFGDAVAYMFDNISVERRKESDPIGYAHPHEDCDNTWQVFNFRGANDKKLVGPRLVSVPPRGAMEMKVTTKKSTNFYVNSAFSFLRGVAAKPAADGVEAMEAKATVEYLRISGLGDAVGVAVAAAASIESSALGSIIRTQTAYPPMVGSGRRRAQIVIDLKKNDTK